MESEIDNECLSKFTYTAYKNLIEKFKEEDYSFIGYKGASREILDEKSVVIFRHDIDLCLEKALEMAKIESQANIQATYFFMLTTDHYNVFSKVSTDIINEIIGLKHDVGIHFDLAAYGPAESIARIWELILKEVEIFETWFDETVDVVSFHRPAPFMYDENSVFEIPILHTYLPVFFSQMRYVADSRGVWRFGTPLEQDEFRMRKPIQVLTHPIWWGDEVMNSQQKLENNLDFKKHFLSSSYRKNFDIFR